MEYTKGEWKVTQIGLDTLIQSFDKAGKLLSFKVASVNGEANAQLIASAPDLYEACKAQHDAIDILFARLIELDGSFFPSKSDKPWEAICQGNTAIAKAEGK